MKVKDYPFLAIAGFCYMFLNMYGTLDYCNGLKSLYEAEDWINKPI